MKTLINHTGSALITLVLAISATSAFADNSAMSSNMKASDSRTNLEGRAYTEAPRLSGSAMEVTRLPCNNPTTLTVNSPTSGPAHFSTLDFTPSQQAGIGSPIFHQMTNNKQFAYTFEFKTPGGCCEIGAATLTVYYRAIQGGSSATAADAGNDAGGPIRHGVGVGGGHIYTQFPFVAGSQKTVSYSIPAGWIASGRVSFNAEDDTAVDHATLTAQMCCVHATTATP
jgi:hypothetical protein